MGKGDREPAADTHHLIPANNRHDAQRFDTHTPRIERGAPVIPLIPKNDIRMDICVQVTDLVVRCGLDFGFPGCFALGVGGRAAAAVDGVGEVPIAVDVHVCEGGGGAVEIDGVFAGVGEGVAAI